MRDIVSESGPATWLFLHGFLGTGSDWGRVLAAWPRAWPRPARVLTPDLPGHGRTLLDAAATPSYAAWVAWLDAYLDAAGVQGPVVLVGYSMGGRLALAWAARHPARVRGVALLAAHPGLVDRDARARRAALDEHRAQTLLRHGLDAFLQIWYAQPLFALHQRPRARAALVAARRGQDPRAMAAVLVGMSPGRQPPLWDALHHLAPRVVYAAGRWDVKYTALAQRLARSRPALPRVAIFARAGHMLPYDVPRAVARWLAEALGPVAGL